MQYTRSPAHEVIDAIEAVHSCYQVVREICDVSRKRQRGCDVYYIIYQAIQLRHDSEEIMNNPLLGPSVYW